MFIQSTDNEARRRDHLEGKQYLGEAAGSTLVGGHTISKWEGKQYLLRVGRQYVVVEVAKQGLGGVASSAQMGGQAVRRRGEAKSLPC